MLIPKKLRSKLKTLIYILILILISTHLSIHSKKAVKNVTIFIHGTFMPGLALLNPFKTYNQTVSPNDRYYKCLKRLRQDPVLYEDSIMLEEGLKKIDSTILYQYSQFNLIPAHSKKGAYQAIGAYDMLSKYINHNKNSDYYTFGFSGILSDNYRKEAGHLLYHELNKIIKKYLQEGYKPVITICAYSHGGNVALYLSDAENIYKESLKIDKLVLYGTPIQEETALFAHDEIFKKIYNFYSQADQVQHNDSFSTSSSQSFRTFKDLYNYNSKYKLDYYQKIIDIRLLAQDDAMIFGHFNFWYFNRYSSWPTKVKPEIEEVCSFLDPLPIAILTPIFLYLVDQTDQSNQIDISILANNQELNILATDTINNKIISQTNNLEIVLNKIQKYAKSSWQPYTNTDETTRLGVGILAALQSLIT